MTGNKISRWFLILLALPILICVSCFDRKETITVDKNGRATIRAEFNGREDSFLMPLTSMLEPDWTIISRKVDSTVPGNPRMELVIEKVVPYGEPLPQNFSGKPSADSSNLQFPTEVRVWSEGSRTFYEFKRTYLAQRYGDINIGAGVLRDQNLENRIFEKGIFNVSEQDRSQYLEEFASNFGYLHWRFLWSSLGQMVRQGKIPVATKIEVEKRALEHSETTVTAVRILGILGKEEDSIGPALDKLELELRLAYEQIFADVAGVDNEDLLRDLSETIDQVKFEHKLSETIESMGIAITVNLPGAVIESNGLADPDEPGKTDWLLSGSDLRTANVVLHALSVVEN